MYACRGRIREPKELWCAIQSVICSSSLHTRESFVMQVLISLQSEKKTYILFKNLSHNRCGTKIPHSQNYPLFINLYIAQNSFSLIDCHLPHSHRGLY